MLETERLRDRFPLTIEQNADRLFTRINIGHEAVANIAKTDPPDKSLPSIYSRERRRTIRCIETAEEAILDDLSHLSQVVRRVIVENFVEPLSRTERSHLSRHCCTS